MSNGLKESSNRQEREYAIAQRNSHADRLIEQFSKTRAGARLDVLRDTAPAKARNTAIAMAMAEQYFKETQYSRDFPTTPENMIRIIRIGTANSNRGDIFTEWQLTSTNDVFFYVDRVISNSVRGATAGTRIYEEVAPNHPTEQDNYTNSWVGNGSTTTFTGTIPLLPAVPFQVKVKVSEASGAGSIASVGSWIASDDGAGAFVGSALDTTASSVNYTTGAVTLEFLVAPVATQYISIDYHWDSEDKTLYTNYGQVKLSVMKQVFNPRPMPLGYSFSQFMDLTLTSTGLINSAQDELVAAVGDEHAIQKDYRAFRRAKQISLSNSITEFDTDFAAAGEDNDHNHAQRIVSSISDMEGELFDDLKRGRLNRAFCGAKALTYLRKHDRWKEDESQDHTAGSYKAGSLDRMEVYAVPSDVSMAATNEIVCTFKNPNEEGETPFVIGVLGEMMAKLDYPDFTTDGNIAVVEDVQKIQPKFIRLLRLTNL